MSSRHSVSQSWRVEHGDCLALMARIDSASVDAIVTDPPYGLGFMGKAWDSLPPGVPWAQECLRVLKPGGHLLAFGGTRTHHRLACAIEDAGFEVRDCLAWLYGSGFPKSLDVSKAIDKAAGAEREVVGTYQRGMAMHPGNEGVDNWREGYTGEVAVTAPATPDAERWQGWGTALKPAHEPIVLARKPLSGTVAGNVLAYGTGALNVDGCRIGTAKETPASPSGVGSYGGNPNGQATTDSGMDPNVGRWPANVVMDEEAAAMLDAQTGEQASRLRGPSESEKFGHATYSDGMAGVGRAGYTDSGGASRFLYVAKASSAERNAGLEGFQEQRVRTYEGGEIVSADHPGTANGGRATTRNVHPTVKPIELMRWLVRLVTPPGGTVLDPFTGSGTTGIAALREGFSFVGIEREAEYVAIARARILGDAPLINGALEMAA